MKNHDVVLAKAQVLQSGFEVGRLHEEIRDNHDQSALFDLLGSGMQALHNLCFALCL